MVRLFVDQKEIAFPPAALTSLDDILKHVERTLLPVNSVIRQICLDGLPIVSPEKESRSPQSLNEISNGEKIEIFTGTVCEIACDSIHEACAYLERLSAVIPTISSSFQVAPQPEAFDHLKQLYQGIYWINLLIDRLRTAFRIDLATVLVDGQNAATHQERFLSIMKQMVEAQESADYTLISDLLEFEIIPIIPIWKGLFRTLEEKIRNGQ